MFTSPPFTAFRRLLPGLLLTLSALMVLISNLPQRLDLMLYDSLQRLQPPISDARVVIIAIDEYSLGRLGRWPWSRRIHAALLDSLSEIGVQSVGFDILFAEPESEDPEADRLFAAAIARNGRVVLPVAPDYAEAGALRSAILPLPQFAEQAAALGHVDLKRDMDGASRSVYLFAGPGTAQWPAFGLALARLAEPGFDFGVAQLRHNAADRSRPATQWVRKGLVMMPVGAVEHSAQVSYFDVLSGQVAQETLHDRVIVIGSTNSGLGDALASPANWYRHRLSGVALNARVANTLLTDTAIVPLSFPLRTLTSLGLILAFFVALLYLPVRISPLVLLAGVSISLLISSGLLLGFRLWFPPVVPMLILTLTHPILIWYRTHSASHAMRRLEHRMRHQARHDPVTGLPNREVLQAEMQQAIREAERLGQHLGLLVVSLDRMREIQGSLDRKTTDRLHSVVAERLRKVIRGNDMVARLSPDEFALLMVDLKDEKPVAAMAGRLALTFRHPVEMNGREFFLAPSIGATLYPHGDKSQADLLQNTRTAMQKARHDKSRDFWFFDEGLRMEVANRTGLDDALRLALQRNEFELFYQPQVLADDGRMVAVEALLRWRHPRRGLVSPAEFIPAAEVNGLIVPIGQWVLVQSCLQAQQWRRHGLHDVRMAINLSAVQFNHTDMLESISQTLHSCGLPAHLLELELTETCLMQDVPAATRTLSQLKTLGVRLAIDDFGTGYSSLSHLKRFPMQCIKLDRSFVHELDSDSETAEITRAIIDMAHRLRMEVTAEGVETSGQEAFLRRHRCDLLQGFRYGRALPAAEITQRLEHASGLTGQN